MIFRLSWPATTKKSKRSRTPWKATVVTDPVRPDPASGRRRVRRPCLRHGRPDAQRRAQLGGRGPCRHRLSCDRTTYPVGHRRIAHLVTRCAIPSHRAAGVPAGATDHGIDPALEVNVTCPGKPAVTLRELLPADANSPILFQRYDRPAGDRGTAGSTFMSVKTSPLLVPTICRWRPTWIRD